MGAPSNAIKWCWWWNWDRRAGPAFRRLFRRPPIGGTIWRLCDPRRFRRGDHEWRRLSRQHRTATDVVTYSRCSLLMRGHRLSNPIRCCRHCRAMLRRVPRRWVSAHSRSLPRVQDAGSPFSPGASLTGASRGSRLPLTCQKSVRGKPRLCRSTPCWRHPDAYRP
jgi:hypothetical protein